MQIVLNKSYNLYAIRRQVIIETNAGSLLTKLLGTVSEKFNSYASIFILEN